MKFRRRAALDNSLKQRCIYRSMFQFKLYCRIEEQDPLSSLYTLAPRIPAPLKKRLQSSGVTYSTSVLFI